MRSWQIQGELSSELVAQLKWQLIHSGEMTTDMEVDSVPGVVTERDLSFGNTLLADDAAKATQPIGLEAADKKDEYDEGGAKQFGEDDDPLLQGHGATHMFNDMHGFSTGVEDIQAPFDNSAPTQLRHMAGLTVGGPKSTGSTDWGTGTDGGKSGKPQDGVPYGFFTGV